MTTEDDFYFVQIDDGFRVGTLSPSDGCDVQSYGYKSSYQYPSVPSHFQGIEVVEIGRCSFRGTSIIEVTLPNTIRRIENHAFLGCSQLSSFFIPTLIIFIGQYAFHSCTSLTIIKYCGINDLSSGLNAWTSVPATHVLVSIDHPESFVSINTKSVSRILTDCNIFNPTISSNQPQSVCHLFTCISYINSISFISFTSVIIISTNIFIS